MKLLLCVSCWDMIKMEVHEIRECKCGKIAGKYLKDKRHAVYSGDCAMPIGIANEDLKSHMKHWESEVGKGIRAWVIWTSWDQIHIRKVKREDLSSEIEPWVDPEDDPERWKDEHNQRIAEAGEKGRAGIP